MNLLHLNLRYYTIYNNNIQFLKRIKNFLYESFLENSIFKGIVQTYNGNLLYSLEIIVKL